MFWTDVNVQMGKVLDDPQRVNMPCLMHDIHLNQLAVKNKITAKSISLSDMRKIVWLVYKLNVFSCIFFHSHHNYKSFDIFKIVSHHLNSAFN